MPLDDNDDIYRGVNEYPFIFQAFFFFFEIPNKWFITVGKITIGCIFKVLMKNIQKNIMHILDISLLILKKLFSCVRLFLTPANNTNIGLIFVKANKIYIIMHCTRREIYFKIRLVLYPEK